MKQCRDCHMKDACLVDDDQQACDEFDGREVAEIPPLPVNPNELLKSQCDIMQVRLDMLERRFSLFMVALRGATYEDL